MVVSVAVFGGPRVEHDLDVLMLRFTVQKGAYPYSVVCNECPHDVDDRPRENHTRLVCVIMKFTAKVGQGTAAMQPLFARDPSVSSVSCSGSVFPEENILAWLIILVM